MSYYFWVAQQEFVYHVSFSSICNLPVFPLKPQTHILLLLCSKWHINLNRPMHFQVSWHPHMYICKKFGAFSSVNLSYVNLLAQLEEFRRWEENYFLHTLGKTVSDHHLWVCSLPNTWPRGSHYSSKAPRISPSQCPPTHPLLHWPFPQIRVPSLTSLGSQLCFPPQRSHSDCSFIISILGHSFATH